MVNNIGNGLKEGELKDNCQAVKPQGKGSDVKEKTLSQLALSVTDAEKGMSAEEREFREYLSQDPEDAWWLSMMDDLLKKYPFDEIKGLYFYSKYVILGFKINANNVSDYLMDEDKEEDILLFSRISLYQRKIIKQADDLYHLWIDPNLHSVEGFLSVLRSLTQKDVDNMKLNPGLYWSPLELFEF